jgi:hypothetical protein
MELTAYQLALIGGAFTVAGALIAVLSGHFLAKKLSSYTYRLQKLDEARNSIIFHFNGVYPVVSEWPDEIGAYLKNKTPELAAFIQQCKAHMLESDFNQLLEARDELLKDIDGYISKQNDPAELFYGNAHPRKGQVRLRDNINNIIACIK